MALIVLNLQTMALQLSIFFILLLIMDMSSQEFIL